MAAAATSSAPQRPRYEYHDLWNNTAETRAPPQPAHYYPQSNLTSLPMQQQRSSRQHYQQQRPGKKARGASSRLSGGLGLGFGRSSTAGDGLALPPAPSRGGRVSPAGPRYHSQQQQQEQQFGGGAGAGGSWEQASPSPRLSSAWLAPQPHMQPRRSNGTIDIPTKSAADVRRKETQYGRPYTPNSVVQPMQERHPVAAAAGVANTRRKKKPLQANGKDKGKGKGTHAVSRWFGLDADDAMQTRSAGTWSNADRKGEEDSVGLEPVSKVVWNAATTAMSTLGRTLVRVLLPSSLPHTWLSAAFPCFLGRLIHMAMVPLPRPSPA